MPLLRNMPTWVVWASYVVSAVVSPGQLLLPFNQTLVLEAVVPADRVELQPGQQYPVHPEQCPA